MLAGGFRFFAFFVFLSFLNFEFKLSTQEKLSGPGSSRVQGIRYQETASWLRVAYSGCVQAVLLLASCCRVFVIFFIF